MSYQIELAPAAVRQLKPLTPEVCRRIHRVLELLADDPRPLAATQLVGGSGEWRVRTGDYRVTYEINEQQVLVLMVRFGHRRDVSDCRPQGLLRRSGDRGGRPSGAMHLFDRPHAERSDGEAIRDTSCGRRTVTWCTVVSCWEVVRMSSGS